MEACVLCRFIPRVDEDIKFTTLRGPVCVSCYYRYTDSLDPLIDEPKRLCKKARREIEGILNNLNSLSWLTK